MYGFDPYIRTMYGPDIPYNPYIVATLHIQSLRYETAYNQDNLRIAKFFNGVNIYVLIYILPDNNISLILFPQQFLCFFIADVVKVGVYDNPLDVLGALLLLRLQREFISFFFLNKKLCFWSGFQQSVYYLHCVLENKINYTNLKAQSDKYLDLVHFLVNVACKDC